MLFDPNKIQVNRNARQRSQLEIDELKESIKLHGQLNAIIVTHEETCKLNPCICEAPILIAGECRLESCKQLEIQIEVKFLDNLSAEELQVIEFEENQKRKPLPWRDEAKAIVKIHNMYLEKDPSWNIKKTAIKVSYSQPTINNAMLIVENINNPLIENANSISQAAELIKRFHVEKTEKLTKSIFAGTMPLELSRPVPDHLLSPKKVFQSKEINVNLDFPSAEQIISEEEKSPIANMGLKTFARYNPRLRYDIIHLDVSDKLPEIIEEIIRTPIIFEAKFLLIWLDQKHTTWLTNKLSPMFNVLQPPIIWYKTDIKTTFNCYESGLIASKKQIELTQKPNIYAFPNANLKPRSVINYYLSMIKNPQEFSFFDPFAKTGNSLQAAKTLEFKSIFGIELNEKLYQEADEKFTKEKSL